MRSCPLLAFLVPLALAACTSPPATLSLDLRVAPLDHGTADVLVNDAATGALVSATALGTATHVDLALDPGQVVTLAWQSPDGGYDLQSYYGLEPGQTLTTEVGVWPSTARTGDLDVYGFGPEADYDEIVTESPDGGYGCTGSPCVAAVDLGRATEPILAAQLRAGTLVSLVGDRAVPVGSGAFVPAAALTTHTVQLDAELTTGELETAARVDVGDDRLYATWLQHDPRILDEQTFVLPDGFGDGEELWAYAVDPRVGSDVFAAAIYQGPAPAEQSLDLTQDAVPHLDSIGFDGARFAWYARPTADSDLLHWALVATDAGGGRIGAWYFAAPPDQPAPPLPEMPAAYRPSSPWAGAWIELEGADVYARYSDRLSPPGPFARGRLTGCYSPFPAAAASGRAGAGGARVGRGIRGALGAGIEAAPPMSRAGG
jgi:hypothetical protein